MMDLLILFSTLIDGTDDVVEQQTFVVRTFGDYTSLR